MSNGNKLEVWESGGSRMYGKCYRQDGGKKLTCDDNGGLACRGIEGEPKQGSCKISVTDVWVSCQPMLGPPWHWENEASRGKTECVLV